MSRNWTARTPLDERFLRVILARGSGVALKELMKASIERVLLTTSGGAAEVSLTRRTLMVKGATPTRSNSRATTVSPAAAS